jgi:heterodisulfide reductase subunit B2
MNMGYYPGCSLTGTGREYDLSLRAVVARLGVELQEIRDWSCCGATSAHVTNHLLATALPARNLLLAHKQSMKEVMAPCAACYNRLLAAQQAIATSGEMKRKVEYVLEEEYREGVEVLNIVQFFERIGADVIRSRVHTDLSGLKVACYYGCLLVRPHALTGFDDAEHPTSMERLIEATGATSVDWNFKTECCGAAHSIARMDIVVDLSKKILDDARLHGADLVVVACPMCHSNLDMRQRNMRRKDATHKDVPVLYLSEFLGLALGCDPASLGLDLHFVDPRPFLKAVGHKEVHA